MRVGRHLPLLSVALLLCGVRLNVQAATLVAEQLAPGCTVTQNGLSARVPIGATWDGGDLGTCKCVSIDNIQCGCLDGDIVRQDGRQHAWLDHKLYCFCDRGKIHCYAKCGGWGDPHYTNFDCKKFDFQGRCRYILSRDCCHDTFTIEILHKPYNAHTSVAKSFTIRYAGIVIDLTPVTTVTVNGNVVNLDYITPLVEIRDDAGWVWVILVDIRVEFRWDWQYKFEVRVHTSYAEKVCGLCGNYNGDPSDDLGLTPTGEPVVPPTIPAWGATWKTILNQPDECGPSDDPPHCVEDMTYQAACVAALSSVQDIGCEIAIQSYIKDCNTELCACHNVGVNEHLCVCQAVFDYIFDCEAANFPVGNEWYRKHGCARCVDPKTGVVHNHGDQWRIHCIIYTCWDGEVTPTKADCCEFGNPTQYYLDGQTWADPNEKCVSYECDFPTVKTIVDQSCCELDGKYHPAGTSYTSEDGCTTYVCTRRDGAASVWVETKSECVDDAGRTYECGSWWSIGPRRWCRCFPGNKIECYTVGSLKGDPHYIDYDGNIFDFQGVCRYVLTRDCCDNKFTIEVVQIQWSATTSIIHSFTIRFGNRVIELRKVMILYIDTVLYPIVGPIALVKNDADVFVLSWFGTIWVYLKDPKVWFRWNWNYYAWVYVHSSLNGKLCGLLGNFNGDQTDDQDLTPTGFPVIPANSIPVWGESWRTGVQPTWCTTPAPGKRAAATEGGCSKSDECKALLADLMKLSQSTVSITAYFVNYCSTELCACEDKGITSGCAGFAAGPYIEASTNVGHPPPDSWKASQNCADCIVNGVVYEHLDEWKTDCVVFRCENGAPVKQPVCPNGGTLNTATCECDGAPTAPSSTNATSSVAPK